MDNVIINLQNKIEENSNNLSINLLQKIFYYNAKNILNNYKLKIKNKIKEIDIDIELIDIEYYFYSDNHVDPYVHKDEKQQVNNRQNKVNLYVHKKQNRGGIDIAFGNKEQNTYGGILIRGVKIKDKYVIGINKVREEIFNKLDIPNSYEALQEFFDKNETKIYFIKNDINHNNKILVSIREGLNSLECKYKYALYRFLKVTKNDKTNKYELTLDIKDKSKIYAINHRIFNDKIKLNIFKKNSNELYSCIKEQFEAIDENCYLKNFCENFKSFLEKEKG